jgi:hypothetical protein
MMEFQSTYNKNTEPDRVVFKARRAGVFTAFFCDTFVIHRCQCYPIDQSNDV